MILLLQGFENEKSNVNEIAIDVQKAIALLSLIDGDVHSAS